MLQVLGRSAAVMAVPEAARPVTLAALTQVGSRRPILVAVPTTAEAERLAHDLTTFLGEEAVELFPAWETLPFERVSPGIETMGRRLRTIWRLRHAPADRMPLVVVAPVRALVQRLGPHVEDVAPLVIRRGEVRDQVELVTWLGSSGYRRESQVEHRGEFAVRGSIVDLFPPTADAPVRIDLWGDEIDRLTTFSVSDQRSVADLALVEAFPCRELLPTEEVRTRADALVAAEPWGREQWERLAEGQIFDGMESWLPWLTTNERTVVDILPGDAQVILSGCGSVGRRGGSGLHPRPDLGGRRRSGVPGVARRIRGAVQVQLVAGVDDDDGPRRTRCGHGGGDRLEPRGGWG